MDIKNINNRANTNGKFNHWGHSQYVLQTAGQVSFTPVSYSGLRHNQRREVYVLSAVLSVCYKLNYEEFTGNVLKGSRNMGFRFYSA